MQGAGRPHTDCKAPSVPGQVGDQDLGSPSAQNGAPPGGQRHGEARLDAALRADDDGGALQHVLPRRVHPHPAPLLAAPAAALRAHVLLAVSHHTTFISRPSHTFAVWDG